MQHIELELAFKKKLRNLIGKTVTLQEVPARPAFHTVSEADNNISTAEANMYEADADSMIKKLVPAEVENTITKPKPKVDPQCMAVNTG